MGAEPRPASLEKQPRPTPFFMLVSTVMPKAPPIAASGEKAPLKIRAKTWPMWEMLTRITTRAAAMYTTAMKGTSFSVTWPMRLMPPKSTSATITATMTPTIKVVTRTWLPRKAKVPAALGVKLSTALLMASAMDCTWVALPIPKAARAASTQNTPPSQAQFLPRPFLI